MKVINQTYNLMKCINWLWIGLSTKKLAIKSNYYNDVINSLKIHDKAS